MEESLRTIYSGQLLNTSGKVPALVGVPVPSFIERLVLLRFNLGPAQCGALLEEATFRLDSVALKVQFREIQRFPIPRHEAVVFDLTQFLDSASKS